MNLPQTSVIIPTYQRNDSVKRLLQALKRQTIQPYMFEVLVVVDGSDDGTDHMIANMKVPYRLSCIWQPNRGRAAARNAGIVGAEGELIVLLDDDMEPLPEFLSAHWHAHQERERLGVLGAVPVRIDSKSPPVAAYIAEKFGQHLEKLSQPGYQLHLRDFYSGNFSIRKETLLAVGLFDEEFKAYGNEDLELSLRLKKAGVSLVYCSQALAYQHYEKDFPALAYDNIAKGQTAVLFVQKHLEVYPELKLSSYRQTSKKWYLLRAALLQLSRFWKKTPPYLIFFMTWLERRRPARLHLYYQLSLDYFFWLGATNEQ